MAIKFSKKLTKLVQQIVEFRKEDFGDDYIEIDAIADVCLYDNERFGSVEKQIERIQDGIILSKQKEVWEVAHGQPDLIATFYFIGPLAKIEKKLSAVLEKKKQELKEAQVEC